MTKKICVARFLTLWLNYIYTQTVKSLKKLNKILFSVPWNSTICVVRPYCAHCAISKILATLYYPLHAKHLESVYTLFIVRITMTDSFESTGLQSLTLKRVIIRKSIKPFHFLCKANLIIDSHHPIRKTLIRNDQSIACPAWFCTRYLVVKIRKKLNCYQNTE